MAQHSGVLLQLHFPAASVCYATQVSRKAERLKILSSPEMSQLSFRNGGKHQPPFSREDENPG
jgi:hypothetical protein